MSYSRRDEERQDLRAEANDKGTSNELILFDVILRRCSASSLSMLENFHVHGDATTSDTRG